MISIKNLVVSYKKDIHVIDLLNLEMQTGKIHGIVGLNGAGKTTLLRVIAGLKTPNQGTVKAFGESKFRKKIAFLETENFFYAYITGREYLSLFKNSNFINDEWNALFGLPLDEIIETYSSGMKKKLALLAAIRQNKPILILDEPFNGLDIESCGVLRMLLLQLREKKTIIVTSHIIQTLTNLCDEIHYLENGKISFSTESQRFDELEQNIFKTIENRHQTLIKALSEKLQKTN
ncbi:MAG: ATP-binding cassette domain-containing protein [Bacteroidetes bacterium]|nr:ATP-binding cassette domain-containing protein [Bacteroidota bacterium]